MRTSSRGWLVALPVAALLASTGASNAAPSAGGLASDNVTYVSTVPFEVGGGLTGARLVGDYLYVAGARSFSIYDVSDPLNPVLESVTATGPQFPNEDVDTNGKILLISNEQFGRTLEIWNVEDKSSPVLLATMASGLPDHTYSCVYGCKYAYGSRGSIIDLRKPAEPRHVGSWGGIAPNDGFDVTEVSPGKILTATRAIRLFDATEDPVHPELIATGISPDERLIHSLRWPNRGRDRFFLVQGETPISQRCEEDSGAFMTWDTTGYRKSHSFRMVDEFRVTNGTFTDGSPPANTTGCTVMWFQEHPSFDDGGLVAAAFFDHGARFLEVSRKGEISENGYFLPVGGQTIATYWITQDIVYAIDTVRGIDILRYEG